MSADCQQGGGRKLPNLASADINIKDDPFSSFSIILIFDYENSLYV